MISYQYVSNETIGLEDFTVFKLKFDSELKVFEVRRVVTVRQKNCVIGFRVKQRNFVFLLFFQSTDASTGVRKAKSRHDMDTAGVRVEIISLCMFTELLRFDTVT